jgi:hypothetical protein
MEVILLTLGHITAHSVPLYLAVKHITYSKSIIKTLLNT